MTSPRFLSALGASAILFLAACDDSPTIEDCEKMTDKFAKCLCEATVGGADPCAAALGCYNQHVGGQPNSLTYAADCSIYDKSGKKVSGGASGTGGVTPGGSGTVSYEVADEYFVHLKIEKVNPLQIPTPHRITQPSYDDFYYAVARDPSVSWATWTPHIRIASLEGGGSYVEGVRDPAIEAQLAADYPAYTDFFAVRFQAGTAFNDAGEFELRLGFGVDVPVTDLDLGSGWDVLAHLTNLGEDEDRTEELLLPYIFDFSAFNDTVTAAAGYDAADWSANGNKPPQHKLSQGGNLQIGDVNIMNSTGLAQMVDVRAELHDGPWTLASSQLVDDQVIASDDSLSVSVNQSLFAGIASGGGYEIEWIVTDAISGGELGRTRQLAVSDAQLSGRLSIATVDGDPDDVHLNLFSDPSHAGETYVMATGISGILSGFPYGGSTIPLYVDSVTLMLIGQPGNAFVSPTIGVLDDSGAAQSFFNAALVPPGNFDITFAAITPQGLVSNSVSWASY